MQIHQIRRGFPHPPPRPEYHDDRREGRTACRSHKPHPSPQKPDLRRLPPHLPEPLRVCPCREQHHDRHAVLPLSDGLLHPEHRVPVGRVDKHIPAPPLHQPVFLLREKPTGLGVVFVCARIQVEPVDPQPPLHRPDDLPRSPPRLSFLREQHRFTLHRSPSYFVPSALNASPVSGLT